MEEQNIKENQKELDAETCTTQKVNIDNQNNKQEEIRIESNIIKDQPKDSSNPIDTSKKEETVSIPKEVVENGENILKEEKKENLIPNENKKDNLDEDLDDELKFYKEICLSSEDQKDVEKMKKYPKFFNYKNYFILKNGTNQAEQEDSNQLFKCEKCKLKTLGEFIVCDICYSAIHENCLVHPSKNTDDWICQRCQYTIKNGIIPECIYCGKERGYLINSKKNKWFHYECSRFFSSKNKEIKINKDRKKVCFLCSKYSDCLVKCNQKGCEKCFHYTCGFQKYGQFNCCDEHTNMSNENETFLQKKTKRNKK